MDKVAMNHKMHDKHEGHSPDMFKRKFWLTAILSLPVVLYSPTIQDLLHFSMPGFYGSEWLPTILGVIIFICGGLIFLKGARSELFDRSPGMMTLISLAITVAFGYSLAVSFGLVEGMDFWWELATLIAIMLLGHWIEMVSVASAQGALKELSKLLPDEAELVTSGGAKHVLVSDLKIGDAVLVRPGTNIPADGVVLKGESDVNESMLTGESNPVKKVVGSEVIGGTINGSGALNITVAKIGQDTVLSGIMKLVSDAQSSKSKTQIIADRAAFYLTIIAIAAAIATAFGWWLFSDQPLSFVLERVVSVLVVACPHALGLAVPLVTAISISLAAKNGLLIRDRAALETARRIDVVLFDKTGTLTSGEQSVVGVVADENYDATRLLKIAASVEMESEHSISKAIVAYARAKKIAIPEATEFKALGGRGARATVSGKNVYVGSERLIEERRATLPTVLKTAGDKAESAGKNIVYVIDDSRVLGIIVIADTVRQESREAVRSLVAAGVNVAMLTGDSENVAADVSKELGITEYFAGILPENKAEIVKKLQKNGDKVAMVGDGVNDAPALVQADVGVAVGAGTDVAIESAGIILVGSDPRAVAKIIGLSRATYHKMVQNLMWAVGYNLLAIPMAAGVLAGFGFILSPAVGAVLMSLSTIIVAVNAQFLRRLRL